jgi:hypothetical protein
MRRIDVPQDIVDDMIILYVNNIKPIHDIAVDFGVSISVMRRVLLENNIHRDKSEAAKLRIAQGHNQVFGQRGDKNPAWKGGRHMRGEYWNIWCPDHPRNNGGYVYEHILVYERTYLPPCQYLPLSILVHHDNGIKTDNRPENLIAVPRGKHNKLLPVMAKRIRDLELENKQLLEQISNLLPI